MTNELFLAQFRQWLQELRGVAATHPGIGAGAVATAMELWLSTLEFIRKSKDADGKPLFHSQRHGVVFPLADALCWLLACRYQILDVLELEQKGPENPVLAEGLAGFVTFFSDLAATQAGRAAGETARICAELVYGFGREGEQVPEQEEFSRLRQQLDLSLAGSRLAKDRAAEALTKITIPEILDYPI